MSNITPSNVNRSVLNRTNEDFSQLAMRDSVQRPVEWNQKSIKRRSDKNSGFQEENKSDISQSESSKNDVSQHFTLPKVKHSQMPRFVGPKKGRLRKMLSCFLGVCTWKCIFKVSTKVSDPVISWGTKNRKRDYTESNNAPKSPRSKFGDKSADASQVQFGLKGRGTRHPELFERILNGDLSFKKPSRYNTIDKKDFVEMHFDYEVKEVEVMKTKNNWREKSWSFHRKPEKITNTKTSTVKALVKVKYPMGRISPSEDGSLIDGPWGAIEPQSENSQKSSSKFIYPESDSYDHSDNESPVKEKWRDQTDFLADLPVNVAPSRISTYQSRKVIPNSANWSERLDMLLLSAVEQYEGNWQKISAAVGSKRSADECRERYDILSKVKLKQGKFTNEEDAQLRKAVEKYGKNFAFIAKKFFKNRTTKQIRDRYMKTLMKKNQTVGPYGVESIIHEKVEEEADVTPRKDCGNVKINIGSLCQESEKHLPEMMSIAQNSPLIRAQFSKVSETSFFTDESVNEDMRGTDKLWYNGLDKGENEANRDENITTQKEPVKYKRSSEHWKHLLSDCSHDSDKMVSLSNFQISDVWWFITVFLTNQFLNKFMKAFIHKL